MAAPATPPQLDWTAVFPAGPTPRAARAEINVAAIPALAPVPARSFPHQTAGVGHFGNDGSERASLGLNGHMSSALCNKARCAPRAGLSAPSDANHPALPDKTGR